MEYKKISQAIDDLDQLHQEHMESFDRTLLPDLESQSLQRDRAMNHLTKKVAALIKTLKTRSFNEADQDNNEQIDNCLAFFHTRISNLLQQNRALALKIRQHRDGIQRSMKNNVTGRSMLRSYGSPDLKLNRPKVMSFTE